MISREPIEPGEEFWPRDNSATIELWKSHPSFWRRLRCFLTFGHRWIARITINDENMPQHGYDYCEKCWKFRKKPLSPNEIIQAVCMKACTEGRVVTGNINRKGQPEEY